MRADADVRCIRLDLEDTGSVFAAARALCAQQVDVFLHNAGAYAIPRGRTQVGLDNVFQINFAAPYYIIRKLMPSLRQRGGRVVVVGSIAHNYSKSDPADIDFSTRRAASKVYGNAKRYLMFSLFSLFESEPDVKLSVTHPGICFTGITAHYPKPIFALIKHPMKWIFPSPEKAALPILAGVLEEIPNGAWCGPAVFDIWGRPRVRVLHTCTQKERAAIARSAEEVFARFLREEAAKN